MATTRLRKTFHYPADSDSDGDPAEGIDEEEQEKIIDTLQRRDEDQTGFYLTAFLSLPLVSALLYLPSLLRPASASAFFAALLAVTSLLATAYVLAFIPAGAPLLPSFLFGGGSGHGRHHGAAAAAAEQQRRRQLVGGLQLRRPGFVGEAGGPVEQFIVPLTGLLNAVMAVRGWASVRRGRATWEEEGMWAVLPMVVWGLVLVVRAQLQPVDVAGLESLRYRYKGA